MDNLAPAPMKHQAPAVGEIEIAVAASRVDFRNVLDALGVLETYLQTMGLAEATEVAFSGECGATLAAVKVIAAQAVGSLSSHVNINAKFAIANSEHLSYSEAATIPTTF